MTLDHLEEKIFEAQPGSTVFLQVKKGITTEEYHQTMISIGNLTPFLMNAGLAVVVLPATVELKSITPYGERHLKLVHSARP